MPDALLGVDGIDWSTFDEELDEYGWIPAALRGLGSKDKKARKEALARLEDGLLHQGGFFLPAAAAAMPFLLALVSDGETEDVDALIVFTTDLALGGHWNHLRGGWKHTSPLAAAAADPAQRRAFVDGIDAIAPHLHHKRATVRAAACMALAFVPERAAELLPPILSRLSKERSGPVRFGALLAAGLLAPAAGEAESVAPILDEALASSKAPERLAGAVAWCWSQDRPLERAHVVDELVAAIGTGARPDKKLLWCSGDLERLATEALMQALREDDRSSLAQDLVRRVAGTRAESKVFDSLFALTFAGGLPASGDGSAPPVPLRTLDTLTEAQRTLLHQLVASRREDNPRYLACSWGTLSGHGLFDLRSDLERFLGLTEAGPLDGLLDGRPLWWHLHRVRVFVVGAVVVPLLM